MKTDLLRFKAITHLSEAEALEFAKEINASNFRGQPFRGSISPNKNKTQQGITLMQKPKR